jgi:hypothetical protein
MTSSTSIQKTRNQFGQYVDDSVTSANEDYRKSITEEIYLFIKNQSMFLGI